MSAWSRAIGPWLRGKSYLLASTTRANYLHALRAAGEFVSKSPKYVTHDDLCRIAEGFGATVHHRSIETYMAVVTAFVRDHGGEDDWDYCRHPHDIPNPIPLHQVQRILSTLEGEGRAAVRDRAIILLMHTGGLRVSEICNLRLGDISCDNLAVRGKGGGVDRHGPRVTRYLPGDTFFESLRTWVLGARAAFCPPPGEDHVFLGQGGRPLTRFAVWRIVHRRGAAAGVKLHPHQLRHSFATEMLNAGAPLMAIRDLLGHSSVTTTQIYTHVAIKRLSAVVDGSHPVPGKCA